MNVRLKVPGQIIVAVTTKDFNSMNVRLKGKTLRYSDRRLHISIQ